MILAYSLKEKKMYAFLLPNMENKKDLDLLLNNDIESKQLYSTYEWTFRENKFYMSPHGCLSFLENAFGDYSYSYDVDLKNKSVGFYKK